jgi:hypothetical protein
MSTLKTLCSFLVPTATAVATMLTFASDPSFFKWHPVGFLAAFLLFSANAVAAMKNGRYLWIHFLLQLATAAAVAFAFYVIFSIKEQFTRPHFWSPQASPHAWVGGAAIVGYLAITLFAALLMSPLHDKSSRVAWAALHRQWGLLFWLVACAALLTGWNKYHELQSPPFIAFAVALAVVSFLNYSVRTWTSWGNLFALPRSRTNKST